ncbi:MAG: tRNA threonylcarbamoyladenosine dehydratase, partial [Bacteroidetes bacterium]|nr:tRNA threonylcarbamoyladenosine dehydratase [Bacteroidota bacterium]
MVEAWLERTNLLIGEKGINILKKSNVLVIGLGGVGSFAAEFLGRSGIGSMTLVDGDKVDISNKNRQLVALDSTIGLLKTEVMAKRLIDINPAINLQLVSQFQEPSDMKHLLNKPFDYILDCIDSIQPKLNLLASCQESDTPLISSMGAGGRINPSGVGIYSLFETKNCPFAQQIRKSYRKMGWKRDIPVVASNTPVITSSLQLTEGNRYKK